MGSVWLLRGRDDMPCHQSLHAMREGVGSGHTLKEKNLKGQQKCLDQADGQQKCPHFVQHQPDATDYCGFTARVRQAAT
jgi:hypothetical protein